MTAQLHDRAKQLFLEACELDAAQRPVFLKERCAGDASLCTEVESLLAFHASRTILDTRGNTTTLSYHESPQERSLAHASRIFWQDLTKHKRRYGLATLAFLLLMLAGVWSLHGVRQSLKGTLRDEIQTILNADIAALELWLDDRQADVERVASKPAMRRGAAELATIARGTKTPREALLQSTVVAGLREAVQPYLDEGTTQKGAAGFLVLDRGGLVLAASDDAEVGMQINPAGVSESAAVFAGKTRVHRPFPKGLFSTNRPVQQTVPLIGISTPILDDAGSIIASLNLGLRADDQFTKILSVARLWTSGETYAFDDRGLMVSDSRFTEQLKSLGLMPNGPDTRAIFNVHVRDPGVDLTSGTKARLPVAARPLTKAAAMAIAGHDGVDLDGYRDYRGRTSIGAWRWLPAYGFGVITEADYDEAYAALRYPMIAAWTPLAMLFAAGCGLLFSAFRLAKIHRQVGLAQKLGQYLLVEKIGEGGMGVVYRARHAMLIRPTAVKLLKGNQFSKTAIARFEREVQLASQLNHPNTIEIYDFGRTPEGIFYYVMEYLEGISLAELVEREGPISIPRAVHILQQICGSLREAHAAGLVHRDIKPANIMLCDRAGDPDFVKVLDFGLAKSVDAAELGTLSTPGMLLGTPLFIAPERLNNPDTVDPRGDLYAVGAVGYELVTGKPIFPYSNEMDLIYKAMNVAPVPPSRWNPEIPPELDVLLTCCLAKSAEERPQSAQDMLDVLDQLADVLKHAPESLDSKRPATRVLRTGNPALIDTASLHAAETLVEPAIGKVDSRGNP